MTQGFQLLIRLKIRLKTVFGKKNPENRCGSRDLLCPVLIKRMHSPPRRSNRPSGRRRECAVNSPRPRAAANCAGAALPTPSIKISGGWRRPLAAGTQKETPAIGRCFFLEVTPGFEPGNQGFADPCLTTWLCHHLGSSILYANSPKKSTLIFEKM